MKSSWKDKVSENRPSHAMLWDRTASCVSTTCPQPFVDGLMSNSYNLGEDTTVERRNLHWSGLFGGKGKFVNFRRNTSNKWSCHTSLCNWLAEWPLSLLRLSSTYTIYNDKWQLYHLKFILVKWRQWSQADFMASKLIKLSLAPYCLKTQSPTDSYSWLISKQQSCKRGVPWVWWGKNVR